MDTKLGLKCNDIKKGSYKMEKKKFKTANIIAIANEKGGVGKTSTSVNLAYFLAKDYRVLLIDFDPQGSASLSYGIKVLEKDKNTIKSCLDLDDDKCMKIKNIKHSKFGVDIVTANNGLSQIQALSIINASTAPQDLLYDALDEERINYDFIIIDTPPQHGFLTQVVIRCCTGIILAIETKFLSVHAGRKLLKTIEAMNKKQSKCKVLGVLPTFYQPNINESKNSLDTIKKHFEDKDSKIKQKHPDAVVFSPIRVNTALSVCTSQGIPVGEFDKSCTGAKCYEQLAIEVLEVL